MNDYQTNEVLSHARSLDGKPSLHPTRHPVHDILTMRSHTREKVRPIVTLLSARRNEEKENFETILVFPMPSGEDDLRDGTPTGSQTAQCPPPNPVHV